MAKIIDGTYDVCITKYEFGQPTKRYGEMVLFVDPINGWLKGSMFPRYFWKNCPFRSGKVEGNHFSFTCFFSSPCQQFVMDVEGTWDGETIQGTVKDPGGEANFFGTKKPQ